MKTTTKFALIAVITGLGFYNLQIDKQATFGVNLSLVENLASADNEDSGSSKSASKREETGTSVQTLYINGKLCKNSTDFRSVTCEGTGTVSCTSSHTISNQTTVC